MTFFLQNPYGLLALLSLPVILGIYWFRRRHRTHQITGLFLWDEPVRSLQGGTQLHRPPPSRSLLLDLLCALLFSFAIASPAILREYGASTILIFDNSLSMRANNNFERAKEIGIQKITGNGCVIFAGENPKVILPPSSSAAACREAVNRYDPYLGQCELQKAVDLARELQPGKLRMQIFTDHAPVLNTPAECELIIHTFAGRGSNPAILKASRSSNNTRQILNLSLSGLESEAAELTVKSGKETLYSEKLGQTADLVHLSLALPVNTQTVTINLGAQVDILNADSTATLLPPPQRTPGFSIGLADADMAKAAQRALFAAGAHEGGDLLITDKDDLKGGVFTLYIPPAQAEQPTYTGPYIIDLANLLCRDLSLEGVYWTLGKPQNLDETPGVLAMAGNIPLYWQESENRAVLNINFKLGNIDRVPAWPVLFANLCEKASLLLPGLAETNYICAQPLQYITAGDEIISDKCYFENTTSKEKSPVNGNLRNALTPAKPGIYNVLNDAAEIGAIAVNPLFPAESDTMLLADEDDVQSKLPPGVKSLMRQPFGLNRLLAGLALLIFLLNSWLSKKSEAI